MHISELLASAAALAPLFAPMTPQDRPGYTDTPKLPDSRWRVHDAERPYPPVVEPCPVGTSAPPSDAVVLFDGESLDAWQPAGKPGEEAHWALEDGALVVNGTGSIETREAFGDCQLHVEWRAPAAPTGEGQGRGNSGVFLMGRYEIQVLDSYENPTYADGQAAAMYGQFPPDVNACRAPGEWQAYDIVFRAPRFEGDELAEPARVTVLHNGVVVHADRAFLGATAHRSVARYAPHAAELPLSLQDHGDPVAFRNVWVRRLELD